MGDVTTIGEFLDITGWLKLKEGLTASPLLLTSFALPFLSIKHLHPPSGQYRSVALFPAESTSFSLNNSAVKGEPGLRAEVDAAGDMLVRS